eukprot:CAMPEP_0172715982 /NCGR_PEP_ID=MMETSP1074-20121228/67856_1 /TAXON_ID=2916 /ORGANISM="Ceratium fusus, Strain PA161109" /LENGTH=293 /DNA_ID=CAMNT_0013540615 /DNA_START=47 /DNA_END=928 /DNA_ORIENTATION=+
MSSGLRPSAPAWELNPDEISIEEKVGSGCTAEVFKGVFRGQIVAVKQIAWNKLGQGEKEQRAFDREVGIMPHLYHPNLVAFLGVTTLEMPLRIITEFCDGGCCFELLHNMEHIELEWFQQLKMIRDVTHAMSYLHSFDPQIIHRDLKSLNLLLLRPVRSSRDIPMVKVSDFGLARMKDQAPNSDWGKMTIAAGTCHWMAPEVVLGSRYDEKVDVYSYSMILFEIVCREIPFEDEEPSNVATLVCQGHRPDLEAVPPDSPEWIRELMITCWAHDARKRPGFDQILAIINNEITP